MGHQEASRAPRLHCDILHKTESLKRKVSVFFKPGKKKRPDSLSAPPLGTLHIPDSPMYSFVPYTEWTNATLCVYRGRGSFTAVRSRARKRKLRMWLLILLSKTVVFIFHTNLKHLSVYSLLSNLNCYLNTKASKHNDATSTSQETDLGSTRACVTEWELSKPKQWNPKGWKMNSQHQGKNTDK